MTTKAPAFTRSARAAAALAAAVALSYATVFWARGFVRDDVSIIERNPLMHAGWSGLPRLLGTGYWEAVDGENTPVQEWRPLASLSFFLQIMTTGNRPGPMRAANVILHWLVCLLLYAALRRHASESAALFGALIFAALPVHAEDVLYITSRTELLAAAGLLGAWLALEGTRPRLTLGAACLAAALAAKEHAILFPAVLALGDWTLHGRKPSQAPAKYAITLGATGAYLAARACVLSRLYHGGHAYFGATPPLSAALTFSRFVVRRYAWPAATGLGLCSDFSRPLIPDSSAASLLSWACLLALAAGISWALRASFRRNPRAFALVGTTAFLLPTAHIIAPLDAIGAERFLYIPTMGLAALAGGTLARLPRRTGRAALAILLAWYAGGALWRGWDWVSPVAFSRAAVECNPVSARARYGLGVALIEEGREAEGEAALHEAAALGPNLGDPWYNLGRLAYARGRHQEAERWLRKSLDAGSHGPDAWLLLALALEAQGRPEDAGPLLEKARALAPDNPVVLFDLGRHYWLSGRKDRATEPLSRFLRLSPDDPDASAARKMLAETR